MHVLHPCPSPSAVPGTARSDASSPLPPATGITTTPDRSPRFPLVTGLLAEVRSGSPVVPPLVVRSSS